MTLEVETLQLGAYGTNCYLVARQGDGSAVVIDPGDEPARVAAALDAGGRTPAGILVTHGHHDHFGAVAELARRYGVDVWMPAGDADRLQAFAAAPYQPEHLVSGGESIELAAIVFDVIPVPGHSPASVAYATDGVVFSGDVLFAGSIGRTDLEGGDLDVLLASIERLVERLPGDTVVAPGHGPPTTLARERQANPFLESLR